MPLDQNQNPFDPRRSLLIILPVQETGNVEWIRGFVILAIVGVAGAATLGTMSIMRGGWNVSGLLVVEPATAVIVWVVSASLFLSIILFALILSFKQS